MEINKEDIQLKIEAYKKQLEEINANANACFGAIRALEALLLINKENLKEDLSIVKE